MLAHQFGRAAEGAAAGKDLDAGMLKDLRPKAKDLYPAAARDRRQLSKVRVIDSEEVVLLRDKKQRVDSKGARAATREEVKMLGTAKKLAAGTKSTGNKIEVICLGKELEGFCLSRSDCCETVDAEVGDTPVLEEEEDSFADIDDILSTRNDQEGGIRGTCMVRKRVEVVTRSGRRTGPVAYGK